MKTFIGQKLAAIGIVIVFTSLGCVKTRLAASPAVPSGQRFSSGGAAWFALGMSLRARDPLRALAAFGAACDESNAQGCAALAAQIKSMEGAVSAIRAAQERACVLGIGGCCLELGEAELSSDAGHTADPLAAAQWFEQACTVGNSVGCHNIGMAYLRGDGIPQDRVKALSLFRGECSRGFVYSCLVAGGMHWFDAQVGQNVKVAKEFFERACALGSSDGCSLAMEAGAR